MQFCIAVLVLSHEGTMQLSRGHVGFVLLLHHKVDAQVNGCRVDEHKGHEQHTPAL